jgi:heme/copper-type cytochrome/quinol oxidase subunit 2
MTRSDLIVLAPWVVFAMVLAVICILLVRSRRAQRRAGNSTHRKHDVPI